MTAQNSLGITAIRTIAVPVSDQQRALDFYTGTLGFETRLDATFNGTERWIEVAPAGSQVTIALPPVHGRATFAIDTGIRLETADATADNAALRDRGVDVDDVLNLPGAPPMFFMRDPDGNTLVVVQNSF